MKQRKIAIMKDTDNWLKVFTPFRNDFVEALKINIPGRDKEPVRNKEGRFEYWRIREQYLNDIIELINDFFPGCEIESDLVSEDVDWVSAVFDAVPDKYTDKLFRALASCFHPDVGGSDEIMARINAEYERRKNEQRA